MTASDYRPTNKIDALPPAVKAAVIEGILAGRPLRDLAKIAGCSPMVVSRFRDSVVIPSLTGQPTGQARQASKTPGTITIPAPIPSPAHDLQARQLGTKDVMRTSPVRERVQSLWATTDKAIRKATKKSQHFGVLPGLLNQGHKNVELLAKLTGEISDGRGGGGPAVAVQIVYHGLTAAPEVTIDADGVLNAPGVRIGSKSDR